MTTTASTSTVDRFRRRPPKIKLLPVHVLTLAVMILLTIGIVTVLDSSYVLSSSSHVAKVNQSAYFFAIKHVQVMMAGFVLIAACHFIGHFQIRRMAQWVVLATIALMCLAHSHKTGEAVLDARRWVSIGGFHAQPSELAKLALILFSASMLARPDCDIKSHKVGFLITGVIAFGFAYSVLKEPDLGTAFIILGTYFCMLYAAGMKPKT